MHGSQADFIASISSGLGFYYLFMCCMNWTATLHLWRKGPRKYFEIPIVNYPVTNALFWFVAGLVFFVLAPFAFIGDPLALPAGVKELINRASGPITLSVGALVAMTLMFLARRFFVKPPVAWSMLNLALLAMGMSMTDPNFKEIVGKPDNVPIVMLVFLLGFFTWLATYKAVINDDRARQGLEPMEKLDSEKVLVWPDLVYTELICMIALTALLLIWGLVLQAPLEEAASRVKTPNPSKAPWYFLGLQEMLVYFDPWYAGVVLPSVVLGGLMAIPYLDFNRKGSGYYTIEQRKFSYLVFQFGFLQLWVVLIILGTFLRGPNWNFFGPFEYWDAHKVIAQNNIDLSQLFWVKGLNMALPKAPLGSGKLVETGYILYRELPGILAVGAYIFLLPPLMAVKIPMFRKFFVKMGFIRYMALANLLLLMASLPIKMVLRWTLTLKYIIHIDEWFLNF